jgi:hypothetical protein
MIDLCVCCGFDVQYRFNSINPKRVPMWSFRITQISESAFVRTTRSPFFWVVMTKFPNVVLSRSIEMTVRRFGELSLT